MSGPFHGPDRPARKAISPGGSPRREFGWLLGIGLAAGLALAFGLLAETVLGGSTTALDRRILLLFRDPANPAHAIGPAWLAEAMRDLTSLGSTLVLGIILLSVLGYLLLAGKRRAMLLVLVSVLGGQVLSTLLKMGFERPRPDLVPNAPQVFTASFPSAHAMLSAVTYLTLGALLMRLETRRSLKAYFLALAVALTVLVGASRVYLGVHWPTDIVAGWCVGTAWATLCWTIALRLQRRGEVEQPGEAASHSAEPRTGDARPDHTDRDEK
jgi:undecaprenyl-diphosphatase